MERIERILSLAFNEKIKMEAQIGDSYIISNYYEILPSKRYAYVRNLRACEEVRLMDISFRSFDIRDGFVYLGDYSRHSKVINAKTNTEKTGYIGGICAVFEFAVVLKMASRNNGVYDKYIMYDHNFENPTELESLTESNLKRAYDKYRKVA